MGRLFAILFFNFLLFYGIIGLIRMIRNKDEENFKQNEKKIKCDSEYYWYNKPHYHVLSNGEKINLPEYFTWAEYKNMSKERFIQKIAYIESMLEKKKYTEETDKKDYIE